MNTRQGFPSTRGMHFAPGTLQPPNQKRQRTDYYGATKNVQNATDMDSICVIAGMVSAADLIISEEKINERRRSGKYKFIPCTFGPRKNFCEIQKYRWRDYGDAKKALGSYKMA